MYNVLILEDDAIQLKTLSKIIRHLGDIYNVYEATNIDDALKISEEVNIDLFYIDINLNKGSGLKFATEVRSMKKYKLTWIVFITVYKEYMLSAFKKIHCYDYIVKPYDIETIERTTKLLLFDTRAQLAVTDSKDKFIIIDIKNIQVKIFIYEIIFVEVFIRTSVIHTINGSFTIDYLSLKKLHSMTNDESIMQSHRSYLVNVNYINKIEKSNDKTAYTIYFSNTDETALLGNNYRKDIMNRFNNRTGEK